MPVPQAPAALVWLVPPEPNSPDTPPPVLDVVDAAGADVAGVVLFPPDAGEVTVAMPEVDGVPPTPEGAEEPAAPRTVAGVLGATPVTPLFAGNPILATTAHRQRWWHRA